MKKSIQYLFARRFLLPASFFFYVAHVAVAAEQTIYRCEDETGNSVITNSKISKQCIVVSKVTVNTDTSPKVGAKSQSTTGNTDNTFPRVQESTQKTRDDDRRHILDQEMTNEERALSQAKKELSDAEAQSKGEGKEGLGDRIAPYRDRVQQHQRNIDVIKQELSKLR